MVKLLFALLFMLMPVIGNTNNASFAQNNPVLHAKIDIKSNESDEFLSYWRDDFRKDDQGQLIAICDIKYNDYASMYSRYAELVKADRDIVDVTPDYEEGYTIKDSIVELVKIHGHQKENNSQERRTLNQSSTITLIVIIAVFGMSVICVFFVMKNQNLIQ